MRDLLVNFFANKELKDRYVQYRKDMADKVLADNAELQGAIKL